MLSDQAPDLFRLHRAGDPVFFDHRRVCVDRPDLPEGQGIEDRLVTVAGKDELASGGDTGHDRCDQASTGPVHQKIGRGCVIKIPVLFHGLRDHRLRLEQIVRARDLRDVIIEEILHEHLIPESAVKGRALVSGHMERYRPAAAVLAQKFCNSPDICRVLHVCLSFPKQICPNQQQSPVQTEQGSVMLL